MARHNYFLKIIGKTYLKLHTFSGAYGFYFYSTNVEVLSERSSPTLLLPL